MLDQSGKVKSTFSQLDRRISSLVNHKMCPSVISKGYDMLKTLLNKQVQVLLIKFFFHFDLCCIIFRRCHKLVVRVQA